MEEFFDMLSLCLLCLQYCLIQMLNSLKLYNFFLHLTIGELSFPSVVINGIKIFNLSGEINFTNRANDFTA
jgi:hypothetical protein